MNTKLRRFTNTDHGTIEHPAGTYLLRADVRAMLLDIADDDDNATMLAKVAAYLGEIS